MRPLVLLKNAVDYKLDKPVLIGEFSTHCSDSGNATNNYQHAYNGGYAGVCISRIDP